MAWPRVGVVVAFLMLALCGLSSFTAALQLNVISKSNTSSSDLSIHNASADGDEYADCFDQPTPRRGLHPAKVLDCYNALNELFSLKYAFRPTTFARRPEVGFRLPRVVRNGTCVISIDVLDDDDADTFEPLIVYTTASEITLRCTQGDFRLGGRTLTGPRGVVDVLVFGRVWPLESGSTPSESAVAIPGELSTRRESDFLNNTSRMSLTRPAVSNLASRDKGLELINPELAAGLECYDPPLPRERHWPIDVTDCENASEEIWEDRERNQKYTFSREVVSTKFYFPLPATFRYRTCVVHLDVENEGDEDTVRLSIVEATAWVLAHKCSGEEKSLEVYGGWGKVGAGTKGLINIWVYGRPWPIQIGATNVTSLVPSQPSSLLDSEKGVAS